MVARDFNPWVLGSMPLTLPARRADGAIVRPPGENRKEDIEFQGLKSLATAVRPTGVDWQFTTSGARIKLKPLSPQVQGRWYANRTWRLGA